MPSLVVIVGIGLALCGCSGERRASNDVDLNAAASEAQRAIDHYAAVGRPPPRRRLAGVAAMPAGVGADGDPKAVVERYYALLRDRHFEAARQLWGGHGSACGRSEGEFQAILAGLSDVRAQVGNPRDAEAGAGQRYVKVPVTLGVASHAAGSMNGALTVTLHRVADGIETSDPDDHRWRIAATAVDAPGAPAAAAGGTVLMPCRAVTG